MSSKHIVTYNQGYHLKPNADKFYVRELMQKIEDRCFNLEYDNKDDTVFFTISLWLLWFECKKALEAE
jgi:hypothetical protein